MRLNVTLQSKQAEQNVYSCDRTSDQEAAGLKKLKGYMIHMPFSSISQQSTGCTVKAEGKVHASYLTTVVGQPCCLG